MKNQKLKDYVLLHLGAPVIAVNLTEEELDFCVQKPITEIGKLNIKINEKVKDCLIKDGALALGQYIISKKKLQNGPNTWMLTPDEDGFASMIKANNDWNNFVEGLSFYRRVLGDSNDECDAETNA